MNGMFNKIDSVDLTSIITESTEEAIQEELNQEYAGLWESNVKQSEEDLLLESIIKEISDSLAISNIRLNRKIVESSINRIYPRFSKSLYNKVVNKLNECGFDTSKLIIKEDEVEDAQKEISDAKQEKEAKEKVTSVTNAKAPESENQAKLSQAYKKLNKAVKDKNEDLENGFGEETITESDNTLDHIGKIFDWISEHALDEDLERFLEDCGITMEQFEDVSKLPLNYAKDIERKALDWVDAHIADDDRENLEANHGIRLEEGLSVNATIDNIDQESKDKATIEKAIELAGDKTTINNDTFRELRLQLANKDYDLIDRTSDYALVRGEDVIYTWTREEDENLKEGVHINVTGDSVDVSTDSVNASVNGSNVDVHVDDNSIEIPEPETELPAIDPEMTIEPAEEIPADEEVLATPEDDNTSIIKDSEELKEDFQPVEEDPSIVQAYYPNATDEEAIKIIKTWNNHQDAIDPNEIGAYPTIEAWLEISAKNGYEVNDMIVETNECDGNLLTENGNPKLVDRIEALLMTWFKENTEDVMDRTIDCKVNEEGYSYVITVKSSLLGKYNLFDEYDVMEYADAAGRYIADALRIEYIGSKKVNDRTFKIYLDNSYKATVETNECDGTLQACDVPGKVDNKRIELAKFESEDKVSYRVSYLNEDDEVCGWDLDCDSDEAACDELDKFANAGQITDDLMKAEFIETGIDGVSSFNYNNTDILLSTDGDSNIITINQDNAEPIVIKGESFDDAMNQLIYWFIMNTDDCEEPAEDLDTTPVEEPVEEPTEEPETEISEPEIDELNSDEGDEDE